MADKRPREDLPEELDERQVDERQVTDLLAGFDDQERARDIFEFLARRRRAHQEQLAELVEALQGARAEGAELQRSRHEMQAEIQELQERVLHAEAEAAAVRELRLDGGPFARAARRAVVTGRAVRRPRG